MRGAQRVAQPLRATKWWLERFRFDDCAIISRFYLSAADFWKRAFPDRLHH